MKSVEPELLFEVDRFSKNSDAISHAVDQLYKKHHSIILESERSIEHVHREYLKLIEPITAQIYNTVAQGRPFMPDDFIGSFTQSSFWMVKTMKQISQVYEQQRRRAVLLTRMASN